MIVLNSAALSLSLSLARFVCDEVRSSISTFQGQNSEQLHRKEAGFIKRYPHIAGIIKTVRHTSEEKSIYTDYQWNCFQGRLFLKK